MQLTITVTFPSSVQKSRQINISSPWLCITCSTVPPQYHKNRIQSLFSKNSLLLLQLWGSGDCLISNRWWTILLGERYPDCRYQHCITLVCKPKVQNLGIFLKPKALLLYVFQKEFYRWKTNVNRKNLRGTCYQISIITIAQKRKQRLLLSLFNFYQNLTSCD
jgi:hypothetical protein